jgi:NAD(P)-dependent dehydrogenase (short-subunit alcohol dehydrogenase family)
MVALSSISLAAERASFIQADLMTVSENKRVIEEIKARFESLDGLVLTAIRPFSKRVVTADGFEGTFSLYYVSRFLLSYGLSELLEQGTNPVIVSLGGMGMTKGEIHWDDLSLKTGYCMITSMLQGGRANDLLGVAFAENHKGSKIRFILDHPGYTNSGTNHVKQPMRTVMTVMAKLFSQPVEKSIQPIIKLMDNPPPQPLIAWNQT